MKKNIFSTVLKTSMTLNILIFLLKFISFYKQILIAKFFGTSIELDLYSIASTFVRGIASVFIDSFSIGFIKKYLEIKKNRTQCEANNFLSGLLLIILIILIIILNIFIFNSFSLAKFLGKKYSYENLYILSKYIKMVSPYIIFSAQIIIFSVLLESQKKFFFPRIEPLISSIVTITVILIFARENNVDILIFSDISSAILFTVILWQKSNLNYKFNFINPFKSQEIKEVVVLSIPLLLSNAAYRINTLIDSILSGRIEGGPSALGYAVPLEQIVVITFIFSLGNVFFSYIINFINEEKNNKANFLLIKILRITIIIIVPISLITFYYSEFLVKIVYFRGNFNSKSLHLTSLALKGYSLGFVFIILKDFCIKFLLAHGKNKMTTIFGVSNTIINIFLSLLLFKKYSLFGITVATSISSFLSFIYIIYYIIKRYKINFKFISYLFFKIITINTFCLLTLSKIVYLNNFFKFLIFCFIYLLLYFVILYIIKIKEIKKFFRRR